MFRFLSKPFLFLIVSCVLYIPPAVAVKIVRLQLEYGSDVVASGGFDIPKTNKILDLELYDDITPITVANYLNYVNNGRYDLTFINRSATNFVLQTGGVNNTPSATYDPVNDPLGTGFGEVIEFPSIVNEPGLSNIRGTIAMAKLSGQPDSANSVWFINLSNNSDLLDTDNGGFTVFGSIIDDGMEIADQVATFPVINLSLFFGSSYSALPLADYDTGDSEQLLFQDNLVMITSATEINRPILRFTPAVANFGFDTAGAVVGKTIDVVLKNTGNEILDIAPDGIGSISAPFSILSEDCSNTSLIPASTDPASSCMIQLQFSPIKADVFTDSLTINYTSQVSGESFSVKYPLLDGGDSDADGILSAIEDAAPNSGDNNIDGIADSLQNSVVSFTGKTGEYISLVIDNNYTMANIATTSDNQLIDRPTDVEFKHGVHEYEVAVDSLGAIIEVGMVLPSGTAPIAYYLFGETEDNATPHWYTYEAINIFANSTVIASNGDRFIRSFVKITVQDGGPGDADKTVNGKVTIGPAAVAYPLGGSDSSSGGLNILLLGVLSILLLLYRHSQLLSEHRV